MWSPSILPFVRKQSRTVDPVRLAQQVTTRTVLVRYSYCARDTCTVRYNDTNHMVLVPYSYSTVPNPAREKNYEYDYSTVRTHDEQTK